MNKVLSVFILLVSITFYGCGNDGPSGPDSNDFNRTTMLENWADNIIIPAYTSFAAQTDQLKSSAEQFTADPTPATLDTLRKSWLEAYLAFQQVSLFEHGKAMELRFRDNLNIYPVNTAELHQNVEEGEYSLELPSQIDRQGFPALDYLLYGLAESDADILAFYTTDSRAEEYQNYLIDLVTRIDTLTNQVLESWNSGFRDEFVSISGNGANASVDMMVNDYIFYYEKALRAGKIGIPAGVFSGTPLSSHVEGYYSQVYSKSLFLEALNAAQNFFNGKHFNSSQEGESLSTYLDFLNTMKEGTDLNALINNQFEAARTEALELNNNFSQQVENDNSKMLQTYDELQKNVVYLKVDMLQALNINVDYIDADGD